MHDEQRKMYAQLSDDELRRVWRGDDCETCSKSVRRYGHVPTYCSECMADRSARGALWIEFDRRKLDPRWHEQGGA